MSKFKLAKSVTDSAYYSFKLNYKKNVEIALIISLLLTILLLRFTSDFHFKKLVYSEEDVMLQLIDIPEIPPPIEEPPELQMEEVVEIPPEEEAAPEEDPNEQIIEELTEEKEEAKLALNAPSDNGVLVSSSALGAISAPELNLRQRLDYRGGSIFFDRGSSSGDFLAENKVDLDIRSTHLTERRVTTDNLSVDLRIDNQQTVDASGLQREDSNKPNQRSLDLSLQPEKVLSFASSTMGTEDYKLWNKLNAELERVSQGRYGPIPKEIRHTRNGFLIAFTYSDQTKHEIHWLRSGRVWIEVFGQSNKTTVQELRRALDGLLSLTLNN
ncbi:MAG: hypothetical protein ACE5HO_17140 [bacterium]